MGGDGGRRQLEKGPLAVCNTKQPPAKLYPGVVMRKECLERWLSCSYVGFLGSEQR